MMAVSFPRTHLLGIPAELRNNIYTHVFEQGGKSTQLDVLLTSKQIHGEAVGIAFGATAFLVDRGYDDEFRPWKLDVRTLSEGLKPFVTNVVVKMDVCGERLPLLFDHGILPEKISIRTMGKTTGKGAGLYTLRRIPGFAVPSSALMRANPRLREIELQVPYKCGTEFYPPGVPNGFDEVRLLQLQLQKMIEDDSELVDLLDVDDEGQDERRDRCVGEEMIVKTPREGELLVTIKEINEPEDWLGGLWKEYGSVPYAPKYCRTPFMMESLGWPAPLPLPTEPRIRHQFLLACAPESD